MKLRINIYIIGYTVAMIWLLAATVLMITTGHVTENIKYMTFVGIGGLLSTLMQKLVTEYRNYKKIKAMKNR